MIDDYKAAGVPPRRVFPQSLSKDDTLYWIQNEPAFGRQAAFLDDANVPGDVVLVTTNAAGRIVPSQAAKDAKAAGLDIITWTLERSGRIVEEVLPTRGTAAPSFYYQSTLNALHNDGDIMVTLDVLARQVGILGIFSDWSGTVSYYASCLGLK